MRTIESVCKQVTSGGTPSRKNPCYFTERGEGFPWVKTKELKDWWVDTTEESITQEGLDNSSAKLLPPRTVLMAMYGATVGQLGILRREMTCNQASCAMIFDPREADAQFLFYNLMHHRHRITALALGAAQQNLNAGQIKSYSLPFPSVSEQQRIAGVLGAFDDLIETNLRSVQALERLGDILLPLASAGGESEQLDEACTTIESGRRPKGGVKGITSGVPSIGAEFIKGLTPFAFAKTKFVPRDFAATMRRGVLHDMDVLVYKDGGKPGEFFPDVSAVGKGYPFDEMVINEHVFRVRARPEIGQGYLYFWLHSPAMMQAMKETGSRTAAIPGLNASNFGALPIRVPRSDAESLRIRLDKILETCLELLAESRDLNRQRDELLPLLMSGKVRVSEVEGSLP